MMTKDKDNIISVIKLTGFGHKTKFYHRFWLSIIKLQKDENPANTTRGVNEEERSLSKNNARAKIFHL